MLPLVAPSDFPLAGRDTDGRPLREIARLQRVIGRLNTDLADGSWCLKKYGGIDFQLMPALVRQANAKYPEMRLAYAQSPDSIARELKETIEQGIESSRFVINMGTEGIHFGVMDYRRIDHATSLILFEPATMVGEAPGVLALRTSLSIESMGLPDCHFAIMEMDLQRSLSECGIFSLALAKKLHTERDRLTRLHQDNIDGALKRDMQPVPPFELDRYLPPAFYKHTQGKRRLDDYLRAMPDAAQAIVNKRNETIVARFTRHLTKVAEKEMSTSLHRKRIDEYQALIRSPARAETSTSESHPLSEKDPSHATSKR